MPHGLSQRLQTCCQQQASRANHSVALGPWHRSLAGRPKYHPIVCTYRFFRLRWPARKVIRTLEHSNHLPGMSNPVRKHLAATVLLCAATALWAAQTQPGVSAPATGIVTRATKAMHYRERGGSVKIAFQGTNLMRAHSGGSGRVELVLSGDAIGSLTGIDAATTASTSQRQ